MSSSRPLRLRNTLTGRVETFEPARPDEVRMYTCGLTVYARGHIGNFRTFVAQDILRRFLEARGYRVVQAQNFTDVDDKTIRGANEAGEPLREYTSRYIEQYYEDADALGIRRAEHYPRATDPEYIAAMIRMVERLLATGAAYSAGGSVYFRIAAFPRYGMLSGAAIEGRLAGARVDSDEYDKENVSDFVLWKGSKPDEPSWDAPFGAGRPGWHLECSAMGLELFGSGFDLHCGGVDLMFPHHENEIAQSEAATGEQFVRHWFHCEHLLVEGRKMSKSLGNHFTIRELLEDGVPAAAIRYLLASVHYRKQLNFTREGLRQAETAVRRVDNLLRRAPAAPKDPVPVDGEDEDIRKCLDRFDDALNDDLNVSRALAEVFHALRKENQRLDAGTADGPPPGQWAAAIRRMNRVLGVFEMEEARPEEQANDGEAIDALIVERREARGRRDFARADAIRDELRTQGIVLEDTPDGTVWRRL